MSESPESVAAKAAEAMSVPAETTPAPTPEVVPSPEVKVEPKTEVIEPVVLDRPGAGELPGTEKIVDKNIEQINNLNKALSIEREERKRLEASLNDVQPVMEKLKSAFSPEVAPEPVVETEEQRFEKWYAQKEAAKSAEVAQQQLQETIKTQIVNLSKEWTGEGGRPKYDDNEVYKWQRDNGKEYLTPEEAFFTMKSNDIIDWKSKQNLSAAPGAVNAEKPSGISTEHAPSITTPKTDQEIKNAVLEALSGVEGV